ncbi:MAG: DoxX family membrane protein [Geminicoccaceae bacterium]
MPTGGDLPMVFRRFLFLSVLLCCWSTSASAHVKWFADYNLVCPPRSPTQIIFGEYFLLFCLAVAPIMFATSYIDQYLVREQEWPSRVADRLTDWTQAYFPMAMRVGVSAFFVSAALYGGFILTPELKTESSFVLAMHVVIAALALHPRTACLAGFGIATLYVYAVEQFGWYHLLDYPIFLGVGAYLMINSLFGEERALVALNTMRWCTGVTLLWAGIEKFAFPEWSFGLLTEQPDLAFGFNAEFYMVSAGFVEFCCAYMLITGMLAARIAALVLLFFFVSAIYYFGLIDAIGHSAIIIVLAILILSRNPMASIFINHDLIKVSAINTVVFFVILLIFIGLYCGGHYLSYHPSEIPHECAL